MAIILANLSAAKFGPVASVVNAFLFIGMDLTARDHLHEAWKDHRLPVKMAVLIFIGSALTWGLNHSAARIAIASCIAFSSAAIVDTIVYSVLGKAPRLMKMNGSNVVSAFVDSLVFPTIAFGGFLPLIVLAQFIAKTLGGFPWTLIHKKGA